MSLLALSLVIAGGPVGPQDYKHGFGGIPATVHGVQGLINPRNHNEFIPLSSVETGGFGRYHTNIVINIGPTTIEHSESPFGGRGPSASLFANPGGLWPVQVAGAYGVTGNGSGVIVIVDAYDYPTALTDFNTFSTQFSLPTEPSSTVTSNSNSVFQIVYGSGSKPSQNSGWNQEEALDIEWAHAMAPSAKIVLVEASDNGSGLYTAVQTGSAIAGVREVSMSWGGSEGSGENSDDTYFSSRSIQYFAAAGDTGAEVIYPSASPNVVSCGGTNLQVNANNTWKSESAWSSGGGGPSSQEPRPSYQNGIALVGTHRGTPDIAAVADNNNSPVAIYWNGSWGEVGGTSVATPVLSGIHNASTTIHRSSEWTWIYNDTTLFHDITTGNNGYAAGTGYDFCTGIGTPKASTSL